MKRILLRLKEYKNEMKPTDLVLVIIMGVLLIQIFINQITIKDVVAYGEIDIVVRTTAAAIFGYFLSANFTSKCKDDQKREIEEKIQELSSMELDEDEKEKEIKELNHQLRKQSCHELQVIIVGMIGILSLLLLLIIKNFVPVHSTMLPGIAQLRDFVSGSVGFLIGTPVSKKKYNK